MLGPLLTISRNTFTESIRQPIFVVLLIAGGLLLVMSLMLSNYSMEDDNQLMIDISLSMLLVLGVVLAALLSAGVLSREIDNKTVLTVISKPIGRPVFILSKYLGVTAAVSFAMVTWSLVFLLVVRHKVLSAAADPVDWPVVIFGSSAFLVALGAGLWCNYFYRWVFNSTFATLLTAGLAVAYLLVLMINRNWEFQPITTEFKMELVHDLSNYGEEEKSLGQLMVVVFLVFEITWIMCAIAIAASTRLGQMMTLVVSVIAAMLGNISGSAPINRTVFRHVLPNFQQLYHADALLQNHPISAGYVLQASVYSLLFIVAVLALAVALFQTRETG